ncbi:MAG: hypothetical protein E7613_05665 [Ruminococcaceae bacterium]|nr:hypothetical protein [Oscillospiraceae bacterium]
MKELLFSLLRFALCDGEATDKNKIEENLAKIYSAAKKHDLGQAVSYGAEKLGINNPTLAKEKALAILRVEKLKFATLEASSVLEKAKIPHILLKGASMRHLYPEEWIRTSCDIDIYVDEKVSEDAAKALIEAGYEKKGYTAQDINLWSPNGCHIELHYVLVNKDRLEKAYPILSRVWEYSVKLTEYRYEMNDEMFYFYHLCHIAKHLTRTGLGIRPFLDLWLMKNRLPQNDKRKELCEKGGLLRFEEISSELCEVWFSGKEHSPITEEYEKYILSSNAYGTHATFSAATQSRSKNKFVHITKRIFMPYSELKNKYPRLRGKPLLFPYYTVKRWTTLAKRDVSKRVKEEMSTSKDDIDALERLFKNLEI